MAKFDKITGHYVYLTIDGIEYRVFYEEVGQGIPMLLQHTAGTYGVEWHNLMNDERVTENFRLISYDLPYHGRSLPPASIRWFDQPYRLKLDFILKFLDAFCDALQISRCVYMGCSMGGHLAADLAYYRPELFRACIGLGTGLTTAENSAGTSAGEGIVDFLNKRANSPMVNIETVASEMRDVCAPNTTDNDREEIAWIYNQGAPGVFSGDIYYYVTDHNLNGKADKIDTSKCMLYVMNSEYDPGTSLPELEALKAVVKGMKGIYMYNMGHFCLMEQYDEFMEYLFPYLEEIKTLK